MFTRFWETIGEELAKAWTARMLGPVFAFWGGGLLAYAYRYGWDNVLKCWEGFSTPTQVALLAVALAVVGFSATVVQRFQDSILRLAEGYWPGPFRRLRFALAQRWEGKLRRKEERWQELAERCGGEPAKLSPPEREEYAFLDAELMTFPVDRGRLMPTRLGNILRAAEEYPEVRYGLVAAVCWPRLWLLLPEEVKKELSEARGRLNSATRLLAWGLLFIVWTMWAWWAAPVGLAVAFIAYRGMLLSALVYGDLLRSSFDLYRFALYEQLNWPLPKPQNEVTSGAKLTRFLFRGI